jgi:anti-sigma-K factor RskA
MNREQIEELAALHALGALDGDDAAAWAKLADEDPEAAAIADGFVSTAASLALLAPAAKAPDALRRRVMDSVFGADPRASAATREASTSPALSWAAAAAVALLALAGAGAVTGQKESVVVRDARPSKTNLNIPLAGYGDFSGVKAAVLWDSGQRGWYVQAGGLPILPPAYAYRVWAVCAKGDLHDCGELPLGSDGSARRFVQPVDAIDSMQGFAVSIEPAGTQPAAPSTPAVLISSSLQG